jgi:hypothetical protein
MRSYAVTEVEGKEGGRRQVAIFPGIGSHLTGETSNLARWLEKNPEHTDAQWSEQLTIAVGRIIAARTLHALEVGEL